MKQITKYLLLLPLLMAVACKKNEDNGSKPSAYINFFNAAEVLQADNGTMKKDNMVYIYDPESNQFNNNFKVFPVFNAINGIDRRQFPDAVSNGMGGTIEFTSSHYWYLYYMGIAPGSYRFVYTGEHKQPLQETTLDIKKDSYTQLYLAEDPAGDDSYRIVAVPDERLGIPGKVRVQVVHLSPDTAPISIGRITADGHNNTAGFPAQLPFGKATGYATLDTLGAAKQFNNIIVQLVMATTPNQPLFTVSLPAENAASYTIVVRGFRETTQRRIITGYDSAKQPIYLQKTISPNLRINLRRNH